MNRLTVAALGASLLVLVGAVGMEARRAPGPVAPRPAVTDLSQLSRARLSSSLRVFQQTPPPDSDAAAARFRFGPLTDAATSQVDKNITTSWRGNTHAWVWGMRANVRPQLKANPVLPRIRIGDVEAGMEFTSYARADAATLATIAYHCGHAAHQGDRQGYLDFLNAAGLPDSAWIPFADAEADPARYFTARSSNGDRVIVTDRVVAPVARQWDVPAARRTGIVIDWEVADRRTGADATRALLAAAAMIGRAGMESTLYVNALNGGNPRNEGIDATTLPALHRAFRWLTVTVWSGMRDQDAASAIRTQLRMLQGTDGRQPIDYRKLQLTVGVGDESDALSPADVTATRAAIVGGLAGMPGGAGRGFGSVNIWRFRGLPAAGSAYDRTVATVLGANDN